MLSDSGEDFFILEQQFRTIFFLAERSPEGKLLGIRYKQFFQISNDLFVGLICVEPCTPAQYRNQIGLDALLRNACHIVKAELFRYGIGTDDAVIHDTLFSIGSWDSSNKPYCIIVCIS